MDGFPEFCLSSGILCTCVWTDAAKGKRVTTQWLGKKNPKHEHHHQKTGLVKVSCSEVFASKRCLNRTPSLSQLSLGVVFVFSNESSCIFKAAQEDILLLNILQKKWVEEKVPLQSRCAAYN